MFTFQFLRPKHDCYLNSHLVLPKEQLKQHFEVHKHKHK